MNYTTRIRKARVIPYGYKVSPDDPKLLLPIPEELDALEQAMRYLRSSSVREVQRWLVATTGRHINIKNLWTKYQAWKKVKYGRKQPNTNEEASPEED